MDNPTFRRSFSAMLLATSAIGLTACATYPADQSYGGAPQPDLPIAATADVEGCWAFTNSKGKQIVNYVEALDAETIFVNSVGSNDVFQYYHIGNGVFQAEGGSASYRFNGRVGSWNSNKTPPKTYRLSHIGFNC